jgi:hypothetical protein
MRVWAAWLLAATGLALGWSNAGIGAPPQPGDIEQHSEGPCSPPIVNNEGHVSIMCRGVEPEALLYLEKQLSEQFDRLNEQLHLNDPSRTIRNLSDLNDNLRKQADDWAGRYHELSARLQEVPKNSGDANKAIIASYIKTGDFAHAEAMVQALVTEQFGPLPVRLAFDDQSIWTPLWREHRAAIILYGTPFGLFLLYASGFLLVLLFAPVRLAGVGSAPLEAIPAPTGNLAFVWGLVRKLWEGVLLLWLCRNRRVRHAWVKEYSTGRRKLGDLGKFARERFVNEPEVLDAWVNARVMRVHNALDALELYGQRRIYVPLPVKVGMERRMLERPDSTMLRETFARPRAVVCIVGGGGSGKSTLACAIARWAMSDDPAERLASQRMLPLFIVHDTTDMMVAVTQALREMLGDEELPDDLIHGLLAKQRLLVIVDAVSEREPETQRHVEKMFASAAVYDSVVITSRTEPRLGAVERTTLYPELLDQKRVVPFIVDYVAKLADAEPLQGGRTLLQLGDRILELAEAGGQATLVTPLLVTMFVDSAMSRARAGAGLEGLPQDVPEIFVDYLKRVYSGPSIEARGTAEDEFIRAARVVARVSLGARLVPSDFSSDHAKAALAEAGLSDRATLLLEALISGGVVERQTPGGIEVLRFGLDPVAEYLAAILSVNNLRMLELANVTAFLNALMKVEGYPRACDGYLKAFATCYRAYSGAFKLRTIPLFPWEVEVKPSPILLQNS